MTLTEWQSTKGKECATETVLGHKTWRCYTIKICNLISLRKCMQGTIHRCLMFVWFALPQHHYLLTPNIWAPRVSSILAFLIGIKRRWEWGLPKQEPWRGYHLESRWRNSQVLVYHGPLQSHLLGADGSCTIYYNDYLLDSVQMVYL